LKSLQLIKKIQKKLLKRSKSEVLKFLAYEIFMDLEEVKKEIRSQRSKEIENKNEFK
jgi:hypothetical protein